MVRTNTREYSFLPTRSVPSVVRRLSAAIFAALLLSACPCPRPSPRRRRRSKAVPKVVFIVGPAGAATDGYRAEARAAAAIARNYTPDVVELYSPNATWPAVKQALEGASLVVYMGHGNGWPSRYRDALYPPTQDGFGLNPKAGGNDATHQYFGEAASPRRSSSPRTRSSCSTTCATRAGCPSRGCRRAPSTRRSSASTTTRPGSSRPAPRRSWPRRGRARRTWSGRSSAAAARSRRLAGRPERQRPPIRLHEHAQPGLRRPDGHRDGDVRVHPLDRDEGRPRAQGRPRRRHRVRVCRAHGARAAARADLDRDRVQARHPGHRQAAGGRHDRPRRRAVHDQGQRRSRASRPASAGIRSTWPPSSRRPIRRPRSARDRRHRGDRRDRSGRRDRGGGDNRGGGRRRARHRPRRRRRLRPRRRRRLRPSDDAGTAPRPARARGIDRTVHAARRGAAGDRSGHRPRPAARCDGRPDLRHGAGRRGRSARRPARRSARREPRPGRPRADRRCRRARRGQRRQEGVERAGHATRPCPVAIA